jgi:hypothetical protein
LAALAPAAARAAPVTVSTDISASITAAPDAVNVTQNLAFTVLPSSFSTGLTITSSSVAGLNAVFQLSGAQTASISVPATFSVARVGGTEVITVRTVASGLSTAGNGAAAVGASQVTGLTGSGSVTGVVAGGLFANPVTITGNLDAGVLSFSVGGAITIANNLVPGEYQGVLTVVAQYN